MGRPSSCGAGLAQNSLLPGKLGEWAAAMAHNLELHMRALDVNDPASKQEYDVYYQLASAHRETAARLLVISNAMAAARDLPMGRHDFTDDLNTEVLTAFEKVIGIRQELIAVLEKAAEQDLRLLAQMRRAQGG